MISIQDRQLHAQHVMRFCYESHDELGGGMGLANCLHMHIVHIHMFKDTCLTFL